MVQSFVALLLLGADHGGEMKQNRKHGVNNKLASLLVIH
jgi:hypothetical protein